MDQIEKASLRRIENCPRQMSQDFESMEDLPDLCVLAPSLALDFADGEEVPNRNKCSINLTGLG